MKLYKIERNETAGFTVFRSDMDCKDDRDYNASVPEYFPVFSGNLSDCYAYIQIREDRRVEYSGEKCPECGGRMVLKHSGTKCENAECTYFDCL